MASLSLAVSTATLGLALLPAGWLSDAVGRTPVMIGSVTLASLLGLACAVAPSFPVLLLLRALQGIALAGLPAVGMAYLSEEIHHDSLGHSMDLYIGGNAIGGMLGRLIAGGLADVGGWRLAVAGVGALGVVCAAIFVRCLPASQHFRARRFSPAALRASLRVQLTDPGLLRLDVIGALLMGAFVAIYNGVGFRLHAAPYGLGQAALAAIFLIYPIGSLSSATAGRLAAVPGPLAGSAWSSGGWNAVMALAGGLLCIALVVSVRLRATPPLTRPLVA
jgi:YNFM family putative membrane transporter